MANIKVNLGGPAYTGQPLTFRSPASCADITGLIVHFPDGDTTASKTFQFADAHGNNVGGKNLFADNVLVKVILDTELNRAYIQNADTNAYLEGRFGGKSDNGHKHTKSEITDFPTSMTPTAHNHEAGEVTSGTFATDRIPSLPASKVTSGTFGVARGGTGKSSWTANRLIYPSGSTTMAQLAFPSVAGSVLRQGTSGAPYWTSLADLATALGSVKVASGSVVGTLSGQSDVSQTVTLGFKPDFVLIHSDQASAYTMVDASFTFVATPDVPAIFYNRNVVEVVSNGFKMNAHYRGINGSSSYLSGLGLSGTTYKYIAVKAG